MHSTRSAPPPYCSAGNVHFCALRGTKTGLARLVAGNGVSTSMAGHYAREAALALLRWYRASSDPGRNIGLLEKAAEIKDRIGELPVPEEDFGPRAPDVQSEG